jgi:predicted  nucleic acid-binding Zn-ribbon protein
MHSPCRIIDGIVSFDDRLRDALDRALADARPQLEREVRAIAEELAQSAAAERRRTASAEIDELRRSVETEMAVLAATTHAFDEASSLGDVLHMLVDYGKRHVDRVGIFVVKDGRLSPWQLEGFDASTPPPSGEGIQAALAQGSHPAEALIFPLIVGRKVVAVLYAENQTRPDRSPAMLDMLACHASRALESMTLNKTLGLMPLADSKRGGVNPR